MEKMSILALAFSLFAFSCSILTSGEKADDLNLENADKPRYEISVSQGDEFFGKIIIETFPTVAPKTCANFDSLVKINFYDGTAFHRVIPGFMIQGGGPNSKNKPKNMWGRDAPGQKTVPAEFSDISHERGIVSMARKSGDINSATSQFFIMVDDNSRLDGKYTVFGRVVKGMEVADKVVNVPTVGKSSPKEKVEMKIERIK